MSWKNLKDGVLGNVVDPIKQINPHEQAGSTKTASIS